MAQNEQQRKELQIHWTKRDSWLGFSTLTNVWDRRRNKIWMKHRRIAWVSKSLTTKSAAALSRRLRALKCGWSARSVAPLSRRLRALKCGWSARSVAPLSRRLRALKCGWSARSVAPLSRRLRALKCGCFVLMRKFVPVRRCSVLQSAVLQQSSHLCVVLETSTLQKGKPSEHR